MSETYRVTQTQSAGEPGWKIIKGQGVQKISPKASARTAAGTYTAQGNPAPAHHPARQNVTPYRTLKISTPKGEGGWLAKEPTWLKAATRTRASDSATPDDLPCSPGGALSSCQSWLPWSPRHRRHSQGCISPGSSSKSLGQSSVSPNLMGWPYLHQHNDLRRSVPSQPCWIRI